MYVTSATDAYDLLLVAIYKIDVSKLPFPMTIKPAYDRPKREDDHEWRPHVIVSMTVNDRDTGASRVISVHIPLNVHWHMEGTHFEMQLMSKVERGYVTAIYKAIRQCVLHEVAECFRYENRRLDDPHEGHAFNVRPEHDSRFPEFGAIRETGDST